METFNRDLSWLEFNQRVLDLAKDPGWPLLERVRYLSIFASNLDEFFMKRIGGLKTQVAAKAYDPFSAGRGSPAEMLAAIRSRVEPMRQEAAQLFESELKPALAKSGIEFLGLSELTESEKKWVNEDFWKRIYPVLTPLSVDPAHPFPFMSNLSISLGVMLKHPDREDPVFARVKVPEVFPFWIPLPGSYRYVCLEDVVRSRLGEIFPGMQITEVMPFRVTRSAELEIDEEDAEDLLELIQEELKERRFNPVVRLEHQPNPNPWILNLLKEELDVTDDDVYACSTVLDLSLLKSFADLPLSKLRFDPWVPMIPPAFSEMEGDVFGLLRDQDFLVHHPYESFQSTVERMVREAAEDSNVLAIKMTLYRTAENSPFIESLIRAAERGKQVVCLIELKARFDEQRNVRFARRLEDAGVHVVYGVVGLKTHCKLLLVVRREGEGVRSYVHIGSGNYHPGTARLYTDLSLFSASPEIAADAVDIFHFLTGRSLQKEYKKLWVAPFQLKDRTLQAIKVEIENARAGRPAQIIAKMNALHDWEVIAALYEASQAGVKIDLIVRGFCGLIPNKPGLSENIRVVSILGRFLEHARIFYFRNSAEIPSDGMFMIGSADWMGRNLHSRVEVLCPIESKENRGKIWDLLQGQLNDHTSSWELRPDGSYRFLGVVGGSKSQSSQALMMQLTRQRHLLEWGGRGVH